MTLDGKAALLGTMYITVCAPRNATCLNLARGAKVGSITVPAPALPTFARPNCYLPCHPLPRPCCDRSPSRTQLHGSVPSRARLARSAARPHANSFAVAAAAAFACRSPQVVAHTGTVLAPLSTPMATTTQHALEPDCSPAEQSPSSMHGCASRVRLSGPEGQVVPQQWLARTSARDVDPADPRRLDLVVYGALRLARRCVAT